MGASAFDLHFESATYGRTDTDRRELADDVAVWRDTAVGVLLIGVEEDDQVRAVATPISGCHE